MPEERAEKGRAICQDCGSEVTIEVDFGNGWSDSPVKLYFECVGCRQAGQLEPEGFGANLGDLFG